MLLQAFRAGGNLKELHLFIRTVAASKVPAGATVDLFRCISSGLRVLNYEPTLNDDSDLELEVADHDDEVAGDPEDGFPRLLAPGVD